MRLTGCGVNVQTGGGVAAGEMLLHESVIFPEKLLIGVIVRSAVAVLPGAMVLGPSGVVTLTVYVGVTASTLIGRLTLNVVEPFVPVIVTL